MRDQFHRIALKVSNTVGSPSSFFLALAVILAWGLTGPLFHFSDTWQLVINTGTTIITFLMVFLIQNTQNRDARVIHLKLDELIRASVKARNSLVDLEELSDVEIEKLEKEFRDLHGRILVLQEKKTKPPHRKQGGTTKGGERKGGHAAS
ncbi:MAG: low affinity iron permease family protein [Fibrobacteria bacterium]